MFCRRFTIVTLLGVASLHGLACFPLLTMMSLFPADQPLSRTWSMVTQMAWETAKVSRPTSLLSFLLSSIPLVLVLFSLLTHSPSSPYSPFPSSLLSPLSPPSVQPSQSFLSASSIHLSLSALILLCPPPAVSLVPWLIECCVPLSKDWVPSCKLPWKHN